jgi:hypothetical protein
MKKTLAPLAAAFALLSAPAAFAQAQDDGTPTPAEMTEEICNDPVEKIVCTPEQRAQLLALLTELAARPEPADEFQAMRYMYDLAEGLRLIFEPTAPAMPLPPRDAADREAYAVCGVLQSERGITCTSAQREELRKAILRIEALPAPQTPAEDEALDREMLRELTRIFPGLLPSAAPQPVAPAKTRRLTA